MNVGLIMFRCTIGTVLGASVGLSLLLGGNVAQGTGLAIIGGVLGLVLALSSVLYKTDAGETFLRGLLFFLHWTAAKNIPGGEHLVPLNDKDIPGRFGEPANVELFGARLTLGMKVGAALAVVPAVVIAVFLPERNPEPLILEIMKRTVIAFAFIAFVGGICGAVVGALTVPGVHRRNIMLGTVLGATMGSGLAIAILPGASVPAWQMFAFGCGLFGWLGMFFGLLAGDNVGAADDKSIDEDDP